MAAVATALLCWAADARALQPGDVSITAITPWAAVDHNNCAASGPHAMYIQVRVKNETAGSLGGLRATLNGFPASPPTPPNPPTAFTLDYGESTERLIGTLAPGASASLYYFVNYPCTLPPAAGSSISYTVTVSDGTPSSITSGALTLTNRSELSANAGGDVVSSAIGAGAVVGQILEITIAYSFGNPSQNADAMIQPVGNVSFDADRFRLVGADIIASTFTAGPLTTGDHQLYFPPGTVSGPSQNSLTVTYYFVALATGVASPIVPFADLRSGGQVKYTGNFGTCTNTPCDTSLPPPSDPFVISKSASPSVLPNGGTVTYTVTVTNTSAFGASIDGFEDILPAGVTYQGFGPGSAVTAANSSIVPNTGDSGTLVWRAQPTAPPPAASVPYYIPAGSSIQLVYLAEVPATPGAYLNSATASAQSLTIGPSSALVHVGPTPTAVPTDTATAVPTDTHTPVPTDTHTPVATDTPTAVPTDTATAVPTDTHTPVATDTPTAVPTSTATAVPTDTHTPVPTDTPTAVPTSTATAVPTDTHTPVPTDTPTAVPTGTATAVPTDTHTPVATDTPTAVPTDTATAVPTDTHTPVPTDTPTVVPTGTATAVPTDTHTPVATDTPTAVPTGTATAVPTDTHTPVPTDTPTAVPTGTATATPPPTEVATATPTATIDPSCGNGVVDPGEECDDGVANSDTTPDACRTNCKLPSCGDGVEDTPIADFIFAIETSVSMSGDLRRIPSLLGGFVEQAIAAGIDYRVALVRFGSGRLKSKALTPDLALDFTTDGQAFRTALANLRQRMSGPTESGTEAIDFALDTLTLRPRAVPVVILITDEDDDLPVSIEPGRLREPPAAKKWSASPRTPLFQGRLDAAARRLIDTHARVLLIVHPRHRATELQYGSPRMTRRDAQSAYDQASTLAALTAARMEGSIQAQVLASGRCEGGRCAEGSLGYPCSDDAQCSLYARALDVRDARRKRTREQFYRDLIGELILLARCRP